MKSKLSWIPFIPLALIACFFMLASGLAPDGAVMGMNSLQLEYAYLFAVGAIFIFSAVFCILDKKIAQYYLPQKNIAAGIVGLILALLLAADGAMTIMRVLNSGKVDVLKVIGAVLSLITAIVFIIYSLNQSFRGKDAKKLSLLNVFPALLCGVRMILCFIDFTTISIRLADVSSLVCFVFATMFFFYYALVLSRVKAKNSVKYCFIFGLPAVAAAIPYGVSKLISSFDSEDIFNNILPVEILLIGLYILAVLIEMTMFVCEKDKIVIEVEKEPEVDPAEKKIDGFFATAINEDEQDLEHDSEYIEDRDTEDFLYQESKQDNIEALSESEKKKDADGYLTQVSDDNNDDDIRPKEYESKLDDIDRLILEISKRSD